MHARDVIESMASRQLQIADSPGLPVEEVLHGLGTKVPVEFHRGRKVLQPQKEANRESSAGWDCRVHVRLLHQRQTSSRSTRSDCGLSQDDR